MVPREIADVDQVESERLASMQMGERAVYPARKGTPKRTRYKKGAKQIRQNGKHRRRRKRITW